MQTKCLSAHMYDIRKEDDGWFSSQLSSVFPASPNFKWNTLVIELSEGRIGDGESKMEAKDMWEPCETSKVTKR